MKKTKRLEMSLAMRIASEHLSYRSLIEEIEGDLERARGAQGGSMAPLLGLLRSFHSQVRAHFALEERGGLFEVYVEREAELGRQAAFMVAQHREFLGRLRHCVDVAGSLERAEGARFEELVKELHELFQALREHERAEDALLERLVDQDIRSLS